MRNDSLFGPAGVLIGLLFAQSIASGITVDGFLDAGEYGPPLLVQDTPTGFGAGLNQLDALYVTPQANGDFNLMITGNLESNGNGIVIFFDTRAHGAVASTKPGGYGVVGSVGGQRTDDWGTDVDGGPGITPTAGGGSVLDPGFDPDFSIEFNIDGGIRYMNVIDMTVSNDPSQPTRNVFLGSSPLFSGPTTESYWVNGGSITYDFEINFGSGAAADAGLEMLLTAQFLNGDPGHEIKIMPFITNGGGDYLSNQFLPGIGGGGNLGGAAPGAPLFDAEQIPGNQFVSIGTVVPEPSGGVWMLAVMVVGLRSQRRRR